MGNHVDTMIRHLEQPYAQLAGGQLAAQVCLLPAEVQHIAGQAVEGAMKESATMAARQFESALAQLPGSRALSIHRDRLVSKLPAALPDSLVATVLATATQSVEQVVADATGMDENPRTVNQAVADVLLRAKAEGNTATGLEMPRIINPGSRGHPELCVRPCIYFAAGTCANGADCGYCHAPHGARPAHLDKRHREQLKDMPFPERASLILPFLRKKARVLGLVQQSTELLESIESCLTLVPSGTPGDSVRQRAAVRHRTLRAALRNLGFLSLWGLLSNCKDTPQRLQAIALNDSLDLLRSHLEAQ